MAEGLTFSSVSEAYVKALAAAIVQRSKVGSSQAMSKRLNITITKMKNFETMKVIDPLLLDMYMQELDISMKGEIHI